MRNPGILVTEIENIEIILVVGNIGIVYLCCSELQFVACNQILQLCLRSWLCFRRSYQNMQMTSKAIIARGHLDGRLCVCVRGPTAHQLRILLHFGRSISSLRMTPTGLAAVRGIPTCDFFRAHHTRSCQLLSQNFSLILFEPSLTLLSWSKGMCLRALGFTFIVTGGGNEDGPFPLCVPRLSNSKSFLRRSSLDHYNDTTLPVLRYFGDEVERDRKG
ncbi:hypothetical protein BJ742DRAFT_388835 [Cladochytrium replicatum]|nr:hypothetical protein BJ742DRAFT_388835 [Cladochytrium replicatum]